MLFFDIEYMLLGINLSKKDHATQIPGVHYFNFQQNKRLSLLQSLIFKQYLKLLGSEHDHY